jgi:hypothetical protein
MKEVAVAYFKTFGEKEETTTNLIHNSRSANRVSNPLSMYIIKLCYVSAPRQLDRVIGSADRDVT